MLVYAKEFNMAVANALKAVSTDKNRPTFCKLHLFCTNNGLVIESCDGFRIHRTEVYVIESTKSFDILVDKLDKIPKGVEKISIEIKDDKLVVYDKCYDFETNYEGLYINTEEVFPKRDQDMCIMFNVKYLKEALQHIGNSNFVELSFAKSKKTGGIDYLCPIVLSCRNGKNMVLPVRPKWEL